MINLSFIAQVCIINDSTLKVFENIRRRLHRCQNWAKIQSLLHLLRVIWFDLYKVTDLMRIFLSVLPIEGMQVSAFVFCALEWVRFLLENWVL